MDPEKKMRIIRTSVIHQLESSFMTPVQLPNSQTIYQIDYCKLKCSSEEKKRHNVVFLTGWGSGYRGIMHLGVNMFCYEDCDVYAVSIPGYGNSHDLTPEDLKYFWKSSNFQLMAKLLAAFLKTKFADQKVDMVAHSMGAKIAIGTAYMYPELFASITLLAPAGFDKRNPLDLMLKLGINGFRHNIDFRNNALWKLLDEYLPKEDSPFFHSKSRLIQRLIEWWKLSRGDDHDLELVAQSSPPLFCIYGQKDNVCNKIKSDKVQSVTLPLWHNLTMYGSEQTAEQIHSFITSIER